MKRILFPICFFIVLCLFACRQTDVGPLLRLAEKQVEVDADSLATLLARIEDPSSLEGEERLLYGWLNAYLHYKQAYSMVEDSLVLPAFDYYVTRGDTLKRLLSYPMKAWYWHWQNRHEACMAVIDSGILRAQALRDTARWVDMLEQKAYWYIYVWKDYPRTIETLHTALALDERAGDCFSMGIAMGLNKNDSALYYMNRSVELAVQAADTAQIVHYLRNCAQLQAYLFYEPFDAIATIRRMEQYVVDNPVQQRIADLVKVEVFLKEGMLDSAQYYLDRERERRGGQRMFLTEENMVALYQSLIDYTRHRTFDILDVARYNDSVANALTALQNTVSRKDESKEALSQANLLLEVERKQAERNLLLVILVLLLVGGGAFLYVRNRRNRLIEAEERAETLTRLLEEATRSQSTTEDGQFFRKILLQQLGMIRLVAKQPTSQNQELLRRIAGITNRELPVESLLVWEDLYPIIDRVYDGFYTKLNSHFGEVLIDKEKQLCCLLRADFSTKEISVVTQQSIPTIYQRKTTIRRKLGMDEKGDIVGFVEGV